MTADPPSAHRTFFDQVSAAWHTSTDGLWIGAGAVGLYQLVIWLRLRFLQPSLPGGTGLWVAVNVLIVLSLVARRRWPLAVTALTSVAMAVTGPPGLQAGMFAPLLVSVYALVSLSGTLQRVVGLGLAVLGACGPDPLVDSDLPLLQTRILSKCLILVVVAAVALLLRSRRRALELSDARLAAQAAGHRLAAQRDTARRQARVAGELHDSVGHSLTAIIALTEGLAGTADDPELDEAIATVNALARDGLADTRSAVNALQPRPGPDDPDDAAGPAAVNAVGAADGNPPAEPGRAHGWDDLTAVLDTTRRTGLAVALTETGPRPQDPGVADAVFTLVREALTNVMRHADGATRVTVALDHSPDRTAVTVVDDGAVRPAASGMRDGAPRPRADPDDGADGTGRAGVPASAPARVHARGHGLAGLAAFAAARGGALVAGPTDAGWRLHATIARGGRP